MNDSSVPTALVSWAHRDQDWSDRQADEWIASVVKFATLLRRNGVDADLDLWNEIDPSVDWTRWGQLKVQECELVIVVASTAWRQRWEGTNSPKTGAGAVSEADALKGIFNHDQRDFQSRTILALLPGVGPEAIPPDLHRMRRFSVKSLDDLGMESLLRSVHKQPLHKKPELGKAPVLPSISYLTPEPPGPQDIAAKRSELDAVQIGNFSALPSERPTAQAHFERPALTKRMDIHELVQELTNHLGSPLVALLANVDDSYAPNKWSVPDGPQPRYESVKSLLLAHRIWVQLSQSKGAQAASTWFAVPCGHLEGKSPAASLRSGRLAEVKAAADSFLEGAGD